MKKKIIAKMITILIAVSIISANLITVFASEKYGDVNSDGVIDASDALHILKHSAKVDVLEENKLIYADVDGNNSIDAKDSLYVLKYSANIISCFPVDEYNEPMINLDSSFDSIEALKAGIATGYTEEKIAEIESLESEENKGAFRKFINSRNEENAIIVPFYNDKVIELRNVTDYSNVLLMSNTVYNQPAVMYYTTHNGYTISTYITYMDALVSEETISQANEKGTLWLYGQIENVVTIPDLVSDYKEHYEKEIQLNNETKKAVIIEFNNTTTDRVFITFAYDNVMVNTFGNRTALEDWLKCVDFKEVPIL